MKYIEIFENWSPPFKSFNPLISKIMKGLDEIYVKDNQLVGINTIKIGIIDKNAAELSTEERLLILIRFSTINLNTLEPFEKEIKITINNQMFKELNYFKYLLDTYCKKGEKELNWFDIYILPLEVYGEFVEKLTLEAEELYNYANKYNL